MALKHPLAFLHFPVLFLLFLIGRKPKTDRTDGASMTNSKGAPKPINLPTAVPDTGRRFHARSRSKGQNGHDA